MLIDEKLMHRRKNLSNAINRFCDEHLSRKERKSCQIESIHHFIYISINKCTLVLRTLMHPANFAIVLHGLCVLIYRINKCTLNETLIISEPIKLKIHYNVVERSINLRSIIKPVPTRVIAGNPKMCKIVVAL